MLPLERVLEPYLVEHYLVEPYLVEPYLVEPYLVEPHVVYIAEESASELHPADLESGAPVVFLELPSVAEQF